MGTKKLLAPRIADLVGTIAPGPFLDLFSGIAAVGSQVGPTRPIWCNDVQHFSTLLTTQHFKSPKAFTSANRIREIVQPYFLENQTALDQRFRALLDREHLLIRTTCANSLHCLVEDIAHATQDARDGLRSDNLHCLFSTTHAGTYFGLRQAIDIDSLRHAADKLRDLSLIDDNEHGWTILALCRAVCAASNSTGHFAQYLSPNKNNIARVLRKRRVDIRFIWEQALLQSCPIGTVRWRRANRIFRTDAVELLKSLAGKARQPAVIYADPPYTSDQYSRYYHVLETLIMYDYPDISGIGQYRPGRFSSGFSLKSSVNSCFEALLDAASHLDSVFILSYPTNGLLEQSTDQLLSILRTRFAYVDPTVIVPHLHSTMGASKGKHKHAVDEQIFVAYQNADMRREARIAGEYYHNACFLASSSQVNGEHVSGTVRATS